MATTINGSTGASQVQDDIVTEDKLNLISTASVPSLEAKGSGSQDGYIQLNCYANTHGIKLKSPPHSAGASYTLTFPNNDGDADQFLQTNGSGVMSWAAPSGGGVTYLGTMNTTSGTEQQITSLDLTDVNILLFVYNQVSHTSGSSQRLTLGIGGNTLYGWGNTISAAQGLAGMLQIDLRNNIGAWEMSQQTPITSGNQWASSYAGHIIYSLGNNLRASSNTNVKVGMSGATFDNGSVNVYGLK